MLVRAAIPTDRKAIVELLKVSMAESAIPKSEALWTWKHELNPFGASFVLVAEDDNKLVGLRAFMQWEWVRNQKIYKAVRAVDTVTHPDYQGKGIFKKLTLRQVEVCRQQGIDFVFNTPNAQSMPGYIKMGWMKQGQMPLKLKLLRPIKMAWLKVSHKKNGAVYRNEMAPFQKWTSEIFDLVDGVQQSPQLTTVVSPQYISWRYANNPLYRYNFITDHDNFLLVFRIRYHAFAKELRLVDFIPLKAVTDSIKTNAYMKASVLKFCKINKIDFIALSGQQYNNYPSCFRWMGLLPVMNVGPVVTLRDLNMGQNFSRLLKVKNWAYSIGDLELF